MARKPTPPEKIPLVPLVRLPEAMARIKDLEAALKWEQNRTDALRDAQKVAQEAVKAAESERAKAQQLAFKVTNAEIAMQRMQKAIDDHAKAREDFRARLEASQQELTALKDVLRPVFEALGKALLGTDEPALRVVA